MENLNVNNLHFLSTVIQNYMFSSLFSPVKEIVKMDMPTKLITDFFKNFFFTENSYGVSFAA